MSPRVVEPTRDELLARRRRLLARTRKSREELEADAQAGRLSPEEFWLYEDIRTVEFLLGEDERG